MHYSHVSHPISVISIGGGDCAVFQWHFYETGSAPATSACVESNDERVGLLYVVLHFSHTVTQSDSDNSDVAEVDSDVEREAQVNYDREEHKAVSIPMVVADPAAKGPDQAARLPPPDSGLTLEFVHGVFSISQRHCLT